MSYNFGALLSACKQGDFERVKHLAQHPVNIHLDNDKLVKVLCEKGSFDILVWLFEFAERTNVPYDFNALLVEFMVSRQNETSIANFIEGVTRFNNKQIKIPLSDNKEIYITKEFKINEDLIKLPPVQEPQVNEVKKDIMSKDEIEKFLEDFTKKMETTCKAIDEFYNQIMEQNDKRIQDELNDNKMVELEEGIVNDIGDNQDLSSNEEPKEMIEINKSEDEECYNLKNAKEMRKAAIKTIIDEIANTIECRPVKGYCEYPISNEQEKYFPELKEILEKHNYGVSLDKEFNKPVIYVKW